MLTKKENAVMDAVYAYGFDKKSFLVTPIDLKKAVKKDVTISQLDETMSALSKDGYFDLVYSDRRGENVYCVTLTDKGRGFRRDKLVRKRNLVIRLFLTVGFAVVSFIVGIILRAVFG